MPVPTTLASLSTTAASNSPAGGENPFPDLDDHIRAGYAFDAQNRDAIATKLNASAVSAFGLTLIDDADAATARATLGAAGLGANTFTGAQTLPGNASTALQAVPKQQAESIATAAVSDRVRVEYRSAQVTSGGTEYGFTGIPSWATRLTVPINGVSTNGTNNPVIQIGAGSYTTAGYAGSQTLLTNSVATSNLSSGFQVGGAAAVSSRCGTLTLTKSASGVWAAVGSFGFADSAGVSVVGGVVDIGGVLDRLRITAGGDTFDGGSIALIIEG